MSSNQRSVLHTPIITVWLGTVEALKRSNYDLQQFAHVASHDLKTPLRSISGFTLLGAQVRSYLMMARSLDHSALGVTDDASGICPRQLTSPLVRLDLEREVAVEVTQPLDAAIRELEPTWWKKKNCLR
jgi:light-regulated signal transduction histidine kinase (bacteriophytochrome)